MTTAVIESLVAGLCVLAFLFVLWRLLERARKPPLRFETPVAAEAYERIERPAMPPELQTARLLMNEQRIRTARGVAMGARVDQLFELINGDLVLVETKTRRRAMVRRSDQVQLTVQRYILLNAGMGPLVGKRLAPYGYVRAVWPGSRPRYLRVPLLIDDIPEELAGRRQALQDGAVPWVADNPHTCMRCKVQERCRVWTDRKSRQLQSWWTPAQRAWLEFTRGWVDTSPLLGRTARPIPGERRASRPS